MNFSIVLASRERVPLLTKFLDSLVTTTHNLTEIEVLVGIDHCDNDTCAAEADLSKKYPFVRFYRRNRSKNINNDYLNWLCQYSSGKFIIACNDDVEVKTHNWDKIALDTLDRYLLDKPDGIVYGFIEDGLSNRHGMGYCCFPLFSRRGLNTLGWLMPGCFYSWNADIASWRVYDAVKRVCHLPIMFNHVSYHTGQRERDHISHNMEKSSREQGMNGTQYNLLGDVEKLKEAMAIKGRWTPTGKYGIVYSFLVPTRERPALLEAFIDSISKNTIDKKIVEICIAFDSDDKKTSTQIGRLNRKFGSLVKFYGKQRSNMINRDYVNWLCKFSNGSFIIPCNDDCNLVSSGWDEQILRKMNAYLADKPDGIVYGKTNEISFPVLSRAAIEQLGYVMHPDFPSLGAEVHLNRVYSALDRVVDISDSLTIEHISHHTGKRPRDNVNMHVERYASRMPFDPNQMDINEDAKRVSAYINFVNGSTKSTPTIIEKSKPKVLFVTEKWCDGNPQAGVTNSHHNLFGSIETADVATYSTLHFDEYYLQYGRNVDNELLRICRESPPDVIVGSYLCHPAGLNVAKETWAIVKSMGIPVIFIWFDSVLPFVANIADSLAPYSAVSVSLDTSEPPVSNKDKFMAMWTPQDIRHYFNPHAANRDIDVCFLGSVQGYTDRINGINALKSNGIEVMHMGGQRENPLPLEAYTSVLQRSKICLSFPKYRGAPFIQAKGRIFEATLCGAMLMDADNDQTKKWFDPGEQYVSFVSEPDLVEKVKYYLSDHEARNRIAHNGWLKSSTSYSPRIFWKLLFERIGL